MTPKSGKKTTEFWISLAVAVGAPVIGLLIARGVVSAAEGQLWADLLAVLAPIVGVAISGYVAKGYTASRTEVKKAAYQVQDGPQIHPAQIEPTE